MCRNKAATDLPAEVRFDTRQAPKGTGTGEFHANDPPRKEFKMLLSLYHSLPPLVKDLAASIKGWQLQRLRYGAETGQLVQEAFARESWSAEQWRAWHEEKLARLLDRAARRVPYYRSLWEQRRRQGDPRAW